MKHRAVFHWLDNSALKEYIHRHGSETMGLSTPATKVWEIPEPKPAFVPPPSREKAPERLPEPTPVKEREKVPAG